MDVLIGPQNVDVYSSCSTVACVCFGNYYSCPYHGCASYDCGSYNFCDTKGGGNPCIVMV